MKVEEDSESGFPHEWNTIHLCFLKVILYITYSIDNTSKRISHLILFSEIISSILWFCLFSLFHNANITIWYDENVYHYKFYAV